MKKKREGKRHEHDGWFAERPPKLTTSFHTAALHTTIRSKQKRRILHWNIPVHLQELCMLPTRP